MTAKELTLAKDVAKVIDVNYKVDKDTTWAGLVKSLYSFYDGNIPAGISPALNYFAIDENRKNWKEFLTYLDYSIYNKKMEKNNVFVGFADATYEKNGYLVVEATVEKENIDCNKEHLNWLLNKTWGKEYGVRRAIRKAPEDNGSWITVKFFTNLPYNLFDAK